jgi:hypothetical protein
VEHEGYTWKEREVVGKVLLLLLLLLLLLMMMMLVTWVPHPVYPFLSSDEQIIQKRSAGDNQQHHARISRQILEETRVEKRERVVRRCKAVPEWVINQADDNEANSKNSNTKIINKSNNS